MVTVSIVHFDLVTRHQPQFSSFQMLVVDIVDEVILVMDIMNSYICGGLKKECPAGWRREAKVLHS